MMVRLEEVTFLSKRYFQNNVCMKHKFCLNKVRRQAQKQLCSHGVLYFFNFYSHNITINYIDTCKISNLEC